jgi:hypothetical protein
MKRVLILGALGCLIVGCGPGDAGKATEEDKAAITKLAKEGIGTGPDAKPAEKAATPPPANGEVAPP